MEASQDKDLDSTHSTLVLDESCRTSVCVHVQNPFQRLQVQRAFVLPRA